MLVITIGEVSSNHFWPGLQSSQSLERGRTHCQVRMVALSSSSTVALGSQFLTSHCPEPVLCSLPDCPLHKTRVQEREREDASKKEVTVFCHLDVEVLSHHLCLLYSLNVLVCPLKRRREYTGNEYWEVGLIPSPLISNLPYMLYSV